MTVRDGTQGGANELPAEIDELLAAVALGPSVLALDYDGTLAPFRVERMEAVPPPEVTTLLQHLVREPATRLVIVSGRPVVEIDALLDLSPRPEVWGVHGWEHRSPDGERSLYALPVAVQAALDTEDARLVADGVATQVERKSAAIAVHWRGLDDIALAALRRLVEEPWAALSVEYGLEIRAFDGGLELRHPGRNKGGVIGELLVSAPPGTPIAYAGDDDTDEDAFRALEGHGLGIRVSAEERLSAAPVRIAPAALLSVLRGWLTATRRVSRDMSALPADVSDNRTQATKAASRAVSD